MNEQVIAKLRALKAEPGIQMRWQDQIDEVIADLSAPPPVEAVKPAEPESALVDDEDEDEPKKPKVHAAASHHKGK